MLPAGFLSGCSHRHGVIVVLLFFLQALPFLGLLFRFFGRLLFRFGGRSTRRVVAAAFLGLYALLFGSAAAAPPVGFLAVVARRRSFLAFALAAAAFGRRRRRFVTLARFGVVVVVAGFDFVVVGRDGSGSSGGSPGVVGSLLLLQDHQLGRNVLGALRRTQGHPPALHALALRDTAVGVPQDRPPGGLWTLGGCQLRLGFPRQDVLVDVEVALESL
mmetsp:Transcript_11111/g.23546  ORF Transcript_11111/g.23546 Transcript_11111/m.23546 type:complete len:217 (-) Transcript_11111:25-675(-)